jgi:hypothetical protein
VDNVCLQASVVPEDCELIRLFTAELKLSDSRVGARMNIIMLLTYLISKDPMNSPLNGNI